MSAYGRPSAYTYATSPAPQGLHTPPLPSTAVIIRRHAYSSLFAIFRSRTDTLGKLYVHPYDYLFALQILPFRNSRKVGVLYRLHLLYKSHQVLRFIMPNALCSRLCPIENALRSFHHHDRGDIDIPRCILLHSPEVEALRPPCSDEDVCVGHVVMPQAQSTSSPSTTTSCA